MGLMMLVTSSLMANLYNKFCDHVKELPFGTDICAEDDDYNHFLVMPVFGYFTMLAWVMCKNLFVSLCDSLHIQYVYILYS